MRILVLSSFFLLSSFDLGPSCGHGPRGPASCARLSSDFDREIASVGVSCDTVADCALVGGAGQWCTAYPSLGANAGGMPVNSVDYENHPRREVLENIEASFAARCAGKSELCSEPGVHCAFDSAPNELACVNHTCVSSPRSCLDTDAGP